MKQAHDLSHEALIEIVSQIQRALYLERVPFTQEWIWNGDKFVVPKEFLDGLEDLMADFKLHPSADPGEKMFIHRPETGVEFLDGKKKRGARMAGKSAPTRAWVLQFKDIGREDDFLTFLDEKKALQYAAVVVGDFAREELGRYDWEESEPEALLEVIEAAKKGRHKEALDAWGEYARDADPDQNVILIESTVGG